VPAQVPDPHRTPSQSGVMDKLVAIGYDRADAAEAISLLGSDEDKVREFLDRCAMLTAQGFSGDVKADVLRNML